MANEAVPVSSTGLSTRSFKVVDANAITKHTLMVLTADPQTASASAGSSSGAFFAGIALSAKEASDGNLYIACDNGGVWDLTASGVVALGQKVILAGANKVQTINNGVAANAASGALVVGTARETASDGEVIEVDLTLK